MKWIEQFTGVILNGTVSIIVHCLICCYRYTPLDYAEQNKHTDCVNLLIQHGGITINSIKNIAAICMQSVYRRHRYYNNYYSLLENKTLLHEMFTMLLQSQKTVDSTQRRNRSCYYNTATCQRVLEESLVHKNNKRNQSSH